MRFLLFRLVLLRAADGARAGTDGVRRRQPDRRDEGHFRAMGARRAIQPLRLSFGSSSTLARQIEQGAPANVFASADEKWMDYLAQKNLIAADTRKDLLGNDLVLVVPGRQAAARHDRPRLRPAGAARPERPAGDRRSGACARSASTPSRR